MYNVTGRLRDNLFSSVLSNSGTRNGGGTSVYPETSPYGRVRDTAPLVRSTPVGTSHGSFMQHSTAQSSDDLGLSHSLDSPSSPGLWPPQVDSLYDIPKGGKTVCLCNSDSLVFFVINCSLYLE